MLKNVILITIDCLRPDHLNCYGYKRITSPFISSLARTGWIFTNFFANSSYTCASIASMITSTYPFDYGEYLEFSTPARLSKKRLLLSEVLKKYGYSTAFFHDNPYLSPIFGYNRGFDVCIDFGRKVLSSIRSKRRFLNLMFKNKKIQDLLWKIKDFVLLIDWFIRGKPIRTDAETILREAYKWSRKASRPFFLWMHLMDTHIPYSPKHEVLKQFGISKLRAAMILYKQIFRKNISKEEVRLVKLLYDSQIYQIDQALAKYLPKMVNHDFEDTYIIITADHGEEFFENGRIGHSGVLTDTLLRVPLIICGGLKRIVLHS